MLCFKEHVYFNCIYTKYLGQDLKKWFDLKTGSTANIKADNILLGNPEQRILLNNLFIIIKQYIYNCRYN